MAEAAETERLLSADIWDMAGPHDGASKRHILELRDHILTVHRIIAEQGARIVALEDKTSRAIPAPNAASDSYTIALT